MSSQTFSRHLVDAYKLFFGLLCAMGIVGLIGFADLMISQYVAERFGWSTTAGLIIFLGSYLFVIAPILTAFAMKALEWKLNKDAGTDK